MYKDSATLCTQIKKAVCLQVTLWDCQLDYFMEWPNKWLEAIC